MPLSQDQIVTLVKLEADIDAKIEASLKGVGGSMEEVTQAVKDLRAAMKEKGEIDALIKANAKLENSNDDLTESNKKLEKSIDRVKEAHDAAKADIASFAKSFGEAQTSINSFMENVNKVKEGLKKFWEYAKAGAEKAGLKKEFDRTTKAMDDLNKSTQVLAASLLESTGALDAMADSAEHASKKVDEHRGGVSLLGVAYDDFGRHLDVLPEEITLVVTSLEAMLDTLDVVAPTYDKASASIGAYIVKLLQADAAAGADVSAVQERIAQIKAQSDALDDFAKSAAAVDKQAAERGDVYRIKEQQEEDLKKLREEAYQHALEIDHRKSIAAQEAADKEKKTIDTLDRHLRRTLAGQDAVRREGRRTPGLIEELIAAAAPAIKELRESVHMEFARSVGESLSDEVGAMLGESFLGSLNASSGSAVHGAIVDVASALGGGFGSAFAEGVAKNEAGMFEIAEALFTGLQSAIEETSQEEINDAIFGSFTGIADGIAGVSEFAAGMDELTGSYRRFLDQAAGGSSALATLANDLYVLSEANMTAGEATTAYFGAFAKATSAATGSLVKDRKAQAAIESAINFAQAAAAIGVGIATYQPQQFVAAAQFIVAGSMYAAIAGGAGASSGASRASASGAGPVGASAFARQPGGRNNAGVSRPASEELTPTIIVNPILNYEARPAMAAQSRLMRRGMGDKERFASAMAA